MVPMLDMLCLSCCKSPIIFSLLDIRKRFAMSNTAVCPFFLADGFNFTACPLPLLPYDVLHSVSKVIVTC